MSGNLFRSWIKNLGQNLLGRGSRRSRRLRAAGHDVRKMRPTLETLEARVVPATITMSTNPLPVNTTTITLSGVGFDNSPPANSVTFTPSSVTGTPTSANYVSLTVSLTGLSSVTAGTPLYVNEVTDSYPFGPVEVGIAAPVVTPAIANLLPTATSLTINGFGFDTNTANDTVSFNDGVSGIVTGATSTQLTLTLSGVSSLPLGTPLLASVAVDGVTSGPTQLAFVSTGNLVVTDAGNGAGSSSDVTLPYAIANAPPGTIITFASSLTGDTITLSSTLNLDAGVDIVGLGAANLTVSGNNGGAVFNVATAVTADIQGLTIEQGAGSNGGGIANSGTLRLSNDVISGNKASANGGGIYNSGSLALVDNTISGNSAAGTGGGIYNSGTLTLTDGTLSGNSASGSGSGIVTTFGNNLVISPVTTTTIGDNIVSQNGGSIAIIGSGTVEVDGSIVDSAGITVSSGVTLDGIGTVPATVVDGTLLPATPLSVGAINTGNLSFGSGGSLLINNVIGFNAIGLDTVAVTGTATLTNATLVVDNIYNLQGGTSFTILSAAGGISGTFNGLPNGSLFNDALSGQDFQIHYTATTVTLTTNLSVVADLPINFDVTGTGTPALTYSTGDLPAGVSLSSTGVFSGIPTEVGPFLVTITESEANVSSTQTITLTVDPGLLAASYFDGALYDFDANTGALAATLIAPYTSSLLSGPSGLTIGPDGNLYISNQGYLTTITGERRRSSPTPFSNTTVRAGC